METKNLVLTKHNGQRVASSRQVAEDFGKDHKHVKESIKDIMRYAENSAHLFYESNYKDSMNRTQVEYLMNRDGFSLLAMGFTGKKALAWKLKYIQAFNEMEQQLFQLPDFTNPVIAARAWADEVEAKEVAQLESAYKSEVIQGLNRELSLADMRQVLNRIVRKVPNYQARWAELYRQFEMKFHMNLKKRTVKSCSILDYIDHNLDMLPELFDIACKLYEGEVRELVQEIYGVA